jgi:hypothetical protein
MASLTVTYASMEEFQVAFDAEISRKGLLVRGAVLQGAQAGAVVSLSVTVTGSGTVEVPARIAAVVPGVGVAVMFDGVPEALVGLTTPLLDAEAEPMVEAEVVEAAEDKAPASVSERLKKMSVTEKMQLAMSGTRDERAALLRDTNKSLHLFVFKNPRLGLDEVQAAVKMPQLSPDAIKMVCDHREWGSNATICAALVRNPKTPMPLALRMLDRVPMTDLKAIARGGARDALVHAARKKLAG